MDKQLFALLLSVVASSIVVALVASLKKQRPVIVFMSSIMSGLYSVVTILVSSSTTLHQMAWFTAFGCWIISTMISVLAFWHHVAQLNKEAKILRYAEKFGITPKDVAKIIDMSDNYFPVVWFKELKVEFDSKHPVRDGETFFQRSKTWKTYVSEEIKKLDIV